MSSALAIPSSRALVSAAPSEMIAAGGDLLRDQLGLQPADMRALQTGIAKYFDPTRSERAKDWIAKNERHIVNITNIGRQNATVQSRLEEVSAQISAATGDLTAATEERTRVQATAKEATESFEQRRGTLSGELLAATASLAEENNLSILPFKNPLTTKAGRMAVAAGQYALSAAVAVVACGQKALFEANCANALSSPFSALTCVSTLTDPRVYLTLAVGAAVGYACNKGMNIAKRILQKEKVATRIEQNLQHELAEHQRTVDRLQSQVEELDQRSSQNLQTLESAQKDREALDTRRQRLESQMSVIRNGKMRDIAGTQLRVLNKALDQEDQAAFGEFGEAAVNTILDTMVATFAEHQPRLAIAPSSQSAPQIEEVVSP